MIDYNHPYIQKQQEIISKNAITIKKLETELEAMKRVLNSFDQLTSLMLKLNSPGVQDDWDALIVKAQLADDINITVPLNEINRHSSYRSEFGNRDEQPTSVASQ